MKCSSAHAPDQQFSSLTACGRKLLISLLVRPFSLRNRFPDRSSSKNMWRGWEASLMTFRALILQQLRKSSWTEGREYPMTLSAPLTLLCMAFLSDILQLEYHIKIQYVGPLTTTPL